MDGYQLKEYETPEGVKPFRKWIKSLDYSLIKRVLTRVDRIGLGYFGINRHLGGGLYEAILDFGPGYRIYFGVQGKRLILLLCGGDKSMQSSDIKKAEAYWRDFSGE